MSCDSGCIRAELTLGFVFRSRVDPLSDEPADFSGCLLHAICSLSSGPALSGESFHVSGLASSPAWSVWALLEPADFPPDTISLLP